MIRKTAFIFPFLLHTTLGRSVGAYEAVTAKGAKQRLEHGCVLFHAWAAWCDICVKELPEWLKHLGQQKAMKPLVIDTSAKTAQEKFSKPWMKNLKPTFPTYFMSGIEDDAFMKKMDANWGRSLPYTALYFNAKKKKEWSGSVSLAEVDAEAEKSCH